MEYCSNCMENIISEPIEAEIERNICPDGIEMDVPVIIYFCSEECKDEYFEPLTTKTKDILTLQLENSILLNTMKEIAVPYPEDITPEQTEILCKYLIARAQEAIRNVEPVKAIDLTKPDLFEQMSDIVKTNVKNNFNIDL